MLSRIISLIHTKKNKLIEKAFQTPYEPLPKDEGDQTIRHVKRPRKWYLPFSLGIVFATSVAVVLFALNSLLYGGLHDGFLPNLAAGPTIWEQDLMFSGASSPETDNAWDTLMPAGRGFVRVPASWREPFGQGIILPDGGQAYAVSMFHQLHCLAIIRTALYNPEEAHKGHRRTSASSTASRSRRSGGHSNKDHDFMVDDDHIGHCFDYLRQAIQCAGDMTLESVMPGDEGAVDGWGITHQCKDWSEAYKWTEMNEPGGRHNYTGIL